MIASQLQMPDCDFCLDEVPDLHQRLDALRPLGPVVKVKYLGDPVWLINDYATLREAFSEEEHFSSESAYRIHSEPSMGRTLQTMSGDMHRLNRSLVSRPFFPARIRELVESLLEPLADQLLDQLRVGEEVEFVRAFCQPYPFSVITAMLGLPMEANDQCLKWAVKIIDYPWDPEGALRARDEFSDFLAPLVVQRREQPGEDILSVLANAVVDGQQLDDEEIFAFCRLLFPAGSDTTYKNLGSLVYAVLSNPGMVERVRSGPEACAEIVQEGLRWQPPTALLPRMCSKSRELGGWRSARATGYCLVLPQPIATPNCLNNPDALTLIEATRIWPSAMVSIFAWVPTWPGENWKWHWHAFSNASRIWPSRPIVRWKLSRVYCAVRVSFGWCRADRQLSVRPLSLSRTGDTTMSTLKADIAALKQNIDSTMVEDTSRLIQRAIARVKESGLAEQALAVGDEFPQFSLPNAVGNAVSSEDILAQGPMVICFYRGGWCPYCNLELRAYQGILDEIRGMGAEFVAISPQLPDESLTMAAKANLSFEVLSDTGNSLAEHIGLVHELPPALVDLYRSMGFDLERINGNMRWTLPLPATYVIDQKHVIRLAFINADYSVRLEPDEVLSCLRSLQP